MTKSKGKLTNGDKEYLNGIARLARFHVAQAVRPLDPHGLLATAIQEIPVEFFKRSNGSYMGCQQSFGQGSLGVIRINISKHILGPHNLDEHELINTLIHEFAHAIVDIIYPNGDPTTNPHGPKWQSVMARLGQKV